MEKVKLKSLQEFEVKNVNQPSEDKLSFTVVGVEDYGTFRSLLTKQALLEIKIYTGETLIGVYEKFVSLQPLAIAEEEGLLNITVTVKQENELETRLNAVENALYSVILSALGGIGSMPEVLTTLYQYGKIDEVGIDIAVNKQWITADEKLQIITSK